MARTKAAKGGAAAPIPQMPADSRADRLDHIALTLLLALIPIRTFVSESHDFGVAAWFRNVSSQTTAHAGHTFLFIAVICACAALVALTRRMGGIAWRPTGLMAGGLLLALAAAISTARAGQKHLAIAGSLDFLALLLYAATLRQLLARPWQLRLALAVILATGAAVIVKCGTQKWIELPATVQLFNEQYRAALAYGQEDPGRLYDFEQRLKSGAVTAYFSHSNVLAGYLILIVMAGIGVASARWKQIATGERVANPAAAVPAVIAALAFATLVFTQSKGGVAAGVAGVGLWAIALIVRSNPRLRASLIPARVAWIVWLGLIALAIAVVALLFQNPQALGRSILFRWLYWQGAADMLRGEGLWGVGAGNFGRFFTQYKPLICPEDVQDPHSWIIRSLSEWGALGLVALLLTWIGWTIFTARYWITFESKLDTTTAQTLGDSPRNRSIGGWAIVLTILTAVVWSIVMAGAESGLWEQTVLIGATCWLATFLMVAIERRRERLFPTAGWPVDPWALVAGLIAFLVHAAIDLELFWPGPATVYFALAAIVQAARGDQTDAVLADRAASKSGAKPPRGPKLALTVVGVAVSIGILSVLSIPAIRLGASLNEARTAPRLPSWSEFVQSTPYAHYQEAIDEYKLDATAIDELSSELIARIESPAHCDSMLPLLESWRARDPHNNAIDQRASMVLATRYNFSTDPRDLEAAITHMKRAVAEHPHSPQRHLALGQLLELKSRSDPAARSDAVAAYEKGLALDEQRTLVSKPNRMPEAVRAQLRERIENLRR